MDDLTRDYLLDLAGLRFLPRPVSALFGPAHRLLTIGFLPPEVRAELGVSWTTRHRRAFNRLVRVLIATERATPKALRRLPITLYERDVRRRIAAGRPIV